MAEGMCAKCSRYLLIIFNFLFWVSGGALLGVGIWIRVDSGVEDSLNRFVHINLPLDVIYTGAYILIAVGAFIFITGFCGCCGAIRESACMLAMYIGCLTVVILGELAAGIYIAVEKGDLEQMLFDSLSSQVKNYTTPGNATIDFLQIQFECCGAHNYSDYDTSEYALTLAPPKKWFVPESCCKSIKNQKERLSDLEKNTCQNEAKRRKRKPSQLRVDGCYDKIKEFLYTNSTILIGIVVGIACLEILGIAFAAWLCRNRTEYWDWE